MRGSPLLRALLLFAALALFAVPLWRLTRPEPAPTAENAPDVVIDPLELQATFLPVPPVQFEVVHLGKTVWRIAGADQAASGPLRLPFPTEGIDLQVRARWAAGQADGAVRLRIVRAGAPPSEKVAWSRTDGSIDEVLTFP